MRQLINLHRNWTSILGLYLLTFIHPLVDGAAAETAAGYRLPQFRAAVAGSKIPQIQAQAAVRLLADSDFPPFSFASQTGSPAGLAVDLALAACAEIKIKCEVQLRPFDQLVPALGSGEGDVIISGPRIDETLLQGALMTRPWFRTMARFAVQSGKPVDQVDATSLKGKRIAVVKDSVHARWLETYYRESELVRFDDAAKAGEALRTGNADVLFGDNLQLIYWVAGPASRGCCRLLGGAYSDFTAFSRNLSFLVRKDRPELRTAFDYGLDMAQTKGTTEKIFNVYVPLNPW